TEVDFKSLSEAPAVMKFWIMQRDIPDAERREGVQLLAEESGNQPVDVLLEGIAVIAREKEERGLEGLAQLLVEQDRDLIRERETQIKELAETTKNLGVKEVCFALLGDIHQNVDIFIKNHNS